MPMSFSRDALYERLRTSLWLFATENQSGDLGQIAVDMEMEGASSWDPAYRAWFDAVAHQPQYAEPEAYLICALFIGRYVVEYWKNSDAIGLVSALTHAARDPNAPRPPFLEPFERP